MRVRFLHDLPTNTGARKRNNAIMSQKKFECKIKLLHIFPYGDYNGGLVAAGFIVEEDAQRDKFGVGEKIRTSLIVKVDTEKRTIETINTIYSY